MARESTKPTVSLKTAPKDAPVSADVSARARFLKAMETLAAEAASDRRLAELPELELLEAVTEMTKQK